ncbi:putative chromosome condensation protein [Tricharina praecox]|uniref:putative chromosome condensation protein n=1 Tax=Tricharina praecox TaxID=43433 RepID=UPI002220327F|nr:putative chromosome condensation protein [Tricharina praecox]KAI5845504.1 putative chromosome condensation protein [Tricharina praecox]
MPGADELPAPHSPNPPPPPNVENGAALQRLERELSVPENSPDLLPNIENVEPVSAPSSPKLAKHLQIHAYLTILSIFGTLARLGLTALTSYNGAPLGAGTVIWSNLAGTAAMGFFMEDARLFGPNRATMPLYTGLTTGFCGSFTSFSSFELDTFRFLVGRGPGGNDFMAAAAYVIATMALALGGLQFGAHVSHALRKVVRPLPEREVRVLDWIVVPLAIACWVAAAVMTVEIPRWRADALWACVFSPLGAYARFWISRTLNPTFRSFPVGTFTCNIGGTLVMAGMSIGMGRSGDADACGVLKGVASGFCGCLTTVSTFVVELRGLSVQRAYWYAVWSIGVGLAAMLVVLGGWTWGMGRELVCST